MKFVSLLGKPIRVASVQGELVEIGVSVNSEGSPIEAAVINFSRKDEYLPVDGFISPITIKSDLQPPTNGPLLIEVFSVKWETKVIGLPDIRYMAPDRINDTVYIVSVDLAEWMSLNKIPDHNQCNYAAPMQPINYGSYLQCNNLRWANRVSCAIPVLDPVSSYL